MGIWHAIMQGRGDVLGKFAIACLVAIALAVMVIWVVYP